MAQRVVCVKLPPCLLDEVEQAAETAGMTRHAFMRYACAQAFMAIASSGILQCVQRRRSGLASPLPPSGGVSPNSSSVLAFGAIVIRSRPS